MISLANDNNHDIGQPLFVSGWVGPLAGVADTESSFSSYSCMER